MDSVNAEQFDSVPIIMSFNCSDPSGGGGIQADIETAVSLGCHCVPVLTAITVQDSATFKRIFTVPVTAVIEQARIILEDMPVRIFKLGMLHSIENIVAITTLLADYPHVAVVFDPQLDFYHSPAYIYRDMVSVLRDTVGPRTQVAVMHADIIREFSIGADTLEACAQDVMAQGIEHLLLLDSKERVEVMHNVLYGHRRFLQTYPYAGLTKTTHHGITCTLSGNISALLAQGLTVSAAVREAQLYTWASLHKGQRLGMGRVLPRRYTCTTVSS